LIDDAKAPQKPIRSSKRLAALQDLIGLAKGLQIHKIVSDKTAMYKTIN